MRRPLRSALPLSLAAALALPAALEARRAVLDPPAAPAGAAVEGEVIALTGEVSIAPSEDAAKDKKNFVPAKVGDKIPAGAVISTGINSECKIKLPTATLKVEQLTTSVMSTLQMAQAAAPEGGAPAQKVEAKIKLNFGTVKFNVQKGALKTDLKISTPNSTTAIQGTDGGVSSYGDQRDQVGIKEGEVVVTVNAAGNYGNAAQGGGGGGGGGGQAQGQPQAQPGEPQGGGEAGATTEITVGAGEVTNDQGQTFTEMTIEHVSDQVYATEGTTQTEQTASQETSGGSTVTQTTDSTFGTATTPVTESVRVQESSVTNLPEPPQPPPF